MAEYTFNLTGWPAIVVGAAIVGVTGFQLASHFQRVDDGEVRVLKAWLSQDFQGLGPRGLAQRARDYQAGRPEQPLPEELPMDIGLTSTSAHGTASNVVIQARITVDGAAPTKGPSLRYFYLTQAPGGQWSVVGESSAVDYYTALLRAKTVLKWRQEFGR